MSARDDLIPTLTTKNFILLFVGTLGLVFLAVIGFAILNDGEYSIDRISESAIYVSRDYVYGLLILIGVYVFGIRVARLSWGAVGIRRCSWDWIVRGILAGVLLFAFRTLIDNVMIVMLGWQRMIEPLRTDRAMLDNGPDVLTIALIFAITILTPVSTEIFQRGILFAWFRRNFNFLLSAVASSALFGVLHIEIVTYGQILIFGLVAAHLYEETKSIWPSVALHTTLGCGYLLSLLNT